MKELYEKTTSLDSLKAAWLSIRRKPRSKGYDEQSISEFREKADYELGQLHEQLSSGSFKFSPLKGVVLAKQTGGLRPIKVLSVRDRVVQKAIEQNISPILHMKYQLVNEASFAYLEDEGTFNALQAISKHYEAGNIWVYRGDIKKFFDTVDRRRLLDKMVFPHLQKDKKLQHLIEKSLNIELGNVSELESRGIDVNDTFPDPAAGLPQGGMLSPLFSNVYLNQFDMEMLKRGFNLVRYADDFVVMCPDKKTATEADRVARSIIEKKLGLALYPVSHSSKYADKKSVISRLRHIEFLGIHLHHSHMYPGSNAWKKMVFILRGLPYRQKGLAWNLSYLQARVESWGTTYHFTRVVPSHYAVINTELRRCLKRITKHYRLQFIDPNISRRTLRRLGMKDFDQSVQYQFNRRKSKAKKQQK